LFQKISRVIVRNALVVPILLYRSEFGALRKKRIEKIDINRDEILQKAGYIPLDHKKKLRIFGIVERRTS